MAWLANESSTRPASTNLHYAVPCFLTRFDTLPGSALLEIQPLKCARSNKMHAYEHTSKLLGLAHKMVAANDGLMCAGIDGQGISVNPDKVVEGGRELYKTIHTVSAWVRGKRVPSDLAPSPHRSGTALDPDLCSYPTLGGSSRGKDGGDRRAVEAQGPAAELRQ